jgi:hypothetical protein
MQVDSSYSRSYLTIISRSPDRIVFRQRHRSWGGLIAEMVGTLIVTELSIMGISIFLSIPFLLTMNYFQNFYKDWGYIISRIVIGGFWSIIIGIVIYFLLRKPLHTLWTFDRNVGTVNFVETSAIGRQRSSTRLYLPRSLKLHFAEENNYSLRSRGGAYWTSKAWAIVRWEIDTTEFKSKIKKEDNQTNELRLLLDDEITYNYSNEVTRQSSIAPPKAIDLFIQLRESFDNENTSQPIRPDVMTVKRSAVEWEFDRIDNQFTKFEELSFSDKICGKSNRIKIPLSTFTGVKWESEKSWIGQKHNIVLQHRDHSNKTIIISREADSLLGHFFYDRLLAWFDN